MNRLQLIGLALMVALGASACDSAFPEPGNDGVGGAGGGDVRGAAGTDGTAGAGGAAYVPDPAPTCPMPDPGTASTTYLCDAGGGNAPTFNADGTQCYSCPGWTIPETGCAIRYPTAISGGMIIHGPHDIFCPFNPCDATLCHPKN